MYIDPMTLFILGEFLVVYIIINVFLFYKGRLYNVLVALLKEMRFEKLRRQQEKQKELAALRASNKGLLNKNKTLTQTVESAGKAIPEQLEERLEALAAENPHAKDLTNAVERDLSAQWLRMRILELEKELLSGNITEETWQELASQAIARLHEQEQNELANTANRKENAEEERYTGQLETDLSESRRQFEDAKIRIRQLEEELDGLKTINTPTDNPLEAPKRGLHEDEIYRLKCDNFDLHESINKLKLELQQANPDIGSDEFIGLLESQIANMEQYIKSADIATGLMEKELAAAQHQIDELQGQLSNLGSASDTVNLNALKELSEQQSAKTDTLGSIKDSIDRLKNGEPPEEIAAEQEAHIARLENIINQSNQCITILESELAQASQDKDKLQDRLDKTKSDLLASKLSGLTDTQQGQKDGIGNIKDLIEELRGGGDLDESLTKQEKEITRLEQFLSESDTLIGQLEAEIDDLHKQLQNQSETAEPEENTRPDSNEDIEEMEELLQQFISDIQSMMRLINQLEDKNKKHEAEIRRLHEEQSESYEIDIEDDRP